MTISCDLLLFVDAANFTGDGKLNLLGEFNLLGTPGPPALLSGKIIFRLKGTAMDVGRPIPWSIRILNGNGDLVGTSAQRELTLSSRVPGVPPAHTTVMDLPPLPLPPDDYSIEIYADGSRLDRVGELHVVTIPPT